ncbi:hypothetical protein Rsub_06510 [Raphidocelis subcapitata]|uniref:Uncharacterized protein n=1 Tax=Raphidocelis subcapitata TaxID=307507 RepID=A0A2V0P8Q0_9CHLO|nr:hypothetical protein Rsub_06510 [Raphidocelis subcapitata]|eukprot:GBF94240.1 hypothetical protein Rsub_06510 [Raphidocelis subcapitata]
MQATRSAGARPAGAARGGRQQQQLARRAAAPPRRRALRPRAQAAPDPPPSGGEPGSVAKNLRQQGLYRLLKGGPERAGADHGEGFVHLLPAGGVLRVDVDALNENLRTNGALRLRHAMRPDEAFGVVINFDGAIADMNAVRAAAWRALAAARDLPLPEPQLRHPALHHTPPEVAAVRVLRWADSQKGGRELAMEHAALAARALAEQAAPRRGVREWLAALGNFNVPTALVSTLDRETVRSALARMALHDHFSAMVTAEDEFETVSQRLLSASLKLARPPCMCVAIDSTPEGVTAAHNCSMKAIGVQGPYRAYQLTNADLTCSSLGELTVYNIRRLFANRGTEMMDAEKAADWQQWDSERRRRSQRRIGIATSPP